MAVCKQCGTTYTPTAEAPGCPKCASVVRRKRPAAEAGAAAPSPTPRPRTASAGAKAGAASAGAAKAPTTRRVVRPAAPPPEEEPHAHYVRDDALIDNTTKYGLIATLALLIIVGTTVLVVYRKKSAMKEAEAAYQAEVTGIHDQLKSLDLNDPSAAASVLELAKDKESVWKDHPLAADIELLLSKARANLAEAEEKRATLDRFTSLESDLKKTDLPPDRMKDLRRQLDEMEARMGTEGAELTARFAAARLTADKTYAKRLLEDAQAFSEANAGNPRPALARYQPVEDEIKGLLDRAYQAKNEELKAYYTPLYQEAIKDADVLATALFRTEGENLPWIDCLQPPQAANWNGSTVSGFSHQVQNGVLQIVGPDPDAGKMAVLSIGDREQWRHLEVDFELVVDKGDMEWYFRLGRSPNNNTLAYPLRTVKNPEHQGASNLEAGKKYSGRITLVGSKLKVMFDGAGEDLDVPGVTETEASWAFSRKGALGFVVLPETRARFTRLKVREVR